MGIGTRQGGNSVEQPGDGEATDLNRPRGPECGDPVGERGLGDDRGDAPVLGADLDDMPSGERCPPERDPVGVDTVESAGVGDRRAPVLELAGDREQLPGSPPESPKWR